MVADYVEKHLAAKKNPRLGPFAVMEGEGAETSFDYVVLGAGSAGCIVAANLAENFPDNSILLVEAGPPIAETDRTVWDPTQWVLVSQNDNLQWGYQSTPQAGLDNRIIPMGRAKGLGGCSIHNGMVYVRGGRKGFDNWAKEGNVGWGYESVLPYFEQVEETLTVTIAESDAFIDSLVAACENQQIPYNANYNQNTDQICVSPFQFAISDEGRRETTYSAFLNDLPSNLVVWTGYLIEKILIDSSKTARGALVSSVSSGARIEISANRGVVLSAGAIGSPQILMLSGVGAGSELDKFGITTICDVPGVGQNFQDDLYVTAWFKSKKPLPDQPYGLMGTVIFDNSPFNDPALGTDIECSLAAGTMAGTNLPPPLQQSWFIYPNIQLLKSRGSVTLASGDPKDAPVIDPNYLNVASDMKNCIYALQLAVRIGTDPALSDWLEDVLLPHTENLEEYIRKTAGTCYHYAGTCKMGPRADSMAVVSPNLRVYGVDKLWVVDSSIIPTTVSGNTAAATMMIAQKGSELISEAAASSR